MAGGGSGYVNSNLTGTNLVGGDVTNGMPIPSEELSSQMQTGNTGNGFARISEVE